MNPRLIAGLSGAAWLAACSTVPLSFIEDRQVSERTSINRYALNVDAIDGEYVLHNRVADSSIPVAPGTHQVLFSAPPPAHFHELIQKSYPMTIAPCTRYYVAAQRANPLTPDWNLVVEYSERVGSCNPDEELKKAGMKASADAPAGQGAALEVTRQPAS
jgi:hypothetical protein